MKLNRRTFLKSSIAATAALSLPARVRAAAEGANGDIRVAVIGFHGRGQEHIKAYSKLSGVRIAAFCDVDKTVLDKAVADVKAKGHDAEGYTDIRKLLENKDIDAVSIATPNHWHSLAAIWALQAGKDVYVEKPVSHEVWEGRQLVKAADKYKRIVQMGVQSRSGYGLHHAIAWANTGALGKVVYVRGLCYKRRPSIGKVDGPQPIPSNIDYDLWCGPAAKLPLMRKNLHYDWHWVWNTGNGDIGNQGIHQMDIARRFLGEPALSPKVFAVGGRLGYVDDGETPNSLFVVHDYEKAPLIFEVRGLPEKTGAKDMYKYRGTSVGVVVQYENGSILCPDYNNATAFDKDGNELKRFAVPKGKEKESESLPTGEEFSENHFGNFIDCVRSKDPTKLHAPILEGHISSALCHTGNISYRLGKKASPDELREAVKGNKEAMDSLERLFTHLAANDVKVDVDKLSLGQFLKMDPKTERFIDNAEADKLLTREYRAPFVVPEIA
ncbi:MAG TPA: Gfo/Idh/MocA family oxidoreductase [Chthoniobacteraceae bacterium]